MYYQFFKVQSTATEADIRKQYKLLARKVHPDKALSIHQSVDIGEFRNNADASNIAPFTNIIRGDALHPLLTFTLLQEAYETLMSPKSRKIYDFLVENGIEPATESSTDVNAILRKNPELNAKFNSNLPFLGLSSEEESTTKLMEICQSCTSVREIVNHLLEMENGKFQRLKYYLKRRMDEVEKEGKQFFGKIDHEKSSSFATNMMATNTRDNNLLSLSDATSEPIAGEITDINTRSNTNSNQNEIITYQDLTLNLKLIKELSQYVNLRTAELGRTAILCAAMRNDRMLRDGNLGELLHFLCLIGGNVNAQSCSGFTALMYLAGKYNIVVGKSDNKSDKHERTSYERNEAEKNVVPHGNVSDLLRFLVTHPDIKSDMHMTTNYGLSALMISCCKQRQTLSQAANFLVLVDLMEKGVRNGSEGVRNGSGAGIDSVRTGIDEIHEPIGEPITPTHDCLGFAADYNNWQLGSLLLEKYPNQIQYNTEYPGKFGRTALSCATALGYVETMKIILDTQKFDQYSRRKNSDNMGDDKEEKDNSNEKKKDKTDVLLINPEGIIDYYKKSFDDSIAACYKNERKNRLIKNTTSWEEILKRYGFKLKELGILQYNSDANSTADSSTASIPTLNWTLLTDYSPFFPEIVQANGKCRSAILLEMILHREVEIELEGFWISDKTDERSGFTDSYGFWGNNVDEDEGKPMSDTNDHVKSRSGNDESPSDRNSRFRNSDMKVNPTSVGFNSGTLSEFLGVVTDSLSTCFCGIVALTRKTFHRQ